MKKERKKEWKQRTTVLTAQTNQKYAFVFVLFFLNNKWLAKLVQAMLKSLSPPTLWRGGGWCVCVCVCEAKVRTSGHMHLLQLLCYGI